jgi:hypothetical protein
MTVPSPGSVEPKLRAANFDSTVSAFAPGSSGAIWINYAAITSENAPWTGLFQ